MDTSIDTVKQLAEVFVQISLAVQNMAPAIQEQSSIFEEINTTIGELLSKAERLNDHTKVSNNSIMTVMLSSDKIRIDVSTMRLRLTHTELL